MKSIERRFKNLQSNNPYWSSLVSFSVAIFGQGFSNQTITRWFNKIVNKDDYAPGDKKTIIGQLINLSKTSEDNKK